jgi:subtilase family serine protease
MMEDDDAIAEARARQIAQISNSSALNTTILTQVQRHKIFLTKLLTSNQSTLDNFVLRLNQEASANYRKPFTKENFKNLFISFHIANNLPLAS